MEKIREESNGRLEKMKKEEKERNLSSFSFSPFIPSFNGDDDGAKGMRRKEKK